jgi:DNA-binding phage protein
MIALALLDMLDSQSVMVTRTELAAMLAGVNVEEVAKAAKVSTKTIYRLRHQRHAPTLDTVERIIEAIKLVKPAEGLAA